MALQVLAGVPPLDTVIEGEALWMRCWKFGRDQVFDDLNLLSGAVDHVENLDMIHPAEKLKINWLQDDLADYDYQIFTDGSKSESPVWVRLFAHTLPAHHLIVRVGLLIRRQLFFRLR